jgi:hypothetical protein
MTTEEQFEVIKAKLDHIGMMGQWYQRYDISKSAQDVRKVIDKLEEDLNEPCGMSRK